MSQLGSITAEKEKQMDLERQRFQEVKAKMLAQQKYKRAARTAGHIVLNIVVALIVLLPLLYAVSIAFMPSGELFTLDMNILPKHPTLENFRQALQKVPLVRFVVNSFLVAGLITFGQIISCSLAAFSFSFLDFKGKNVLFMLVMATMMIPGEATIISNYLTVSGWNCMKACAGTPTCLGSACSYTAVPSKFARPWASFGKCAGTQSRITPILF